MSSDIMQSPLIFICAASSIVQKDEVKGLLHVVSYHDVTKSTNLLATIQFSFVPPLGSDGTKGLISTIESMVSSH